MDYITMDDSPMGGTQSHRFRVEWDNYNRRVGKIMNMRTSVTGKTLITVMRTPRELYGKFLIKSQESSPYGTMADLDYYVSQPVIRITHHDGSNAKYTFVDGVDKRPYSPGEEYYEVNFRLVEVFT